jgi:hypothetical protein
MAFLKDYIGELSTAVLRQLKRDIVAEQRKRTETETSANSQVSGKQPTGQSSGLQPGSVGGGGMGLVFKKAPRDTAGKRKANELDSSKSGGPMEPAARRPAPSPLSLPVQEKGKTSAQ